MAVVLGNRNWSVSISSRGIAIVNQNVIQITSNVICNTDFFDAFQVLSPAKAQYRLL